MNILALVESWGLGGTEKYISTTACQLANIGCNTFVFDLKKKEIRDSSCLPIDTGSASPGQTVFESIQQACDQLNISIVHSHLYTSTFSICRRISRRSELPLVATYHLPLQQWNTWHRLRLGHSTRFLKQTIGASELTATQLKRWAPSACCIPPPIKIPTDLHLLRERPSNRFNVVGLGRLEKQKDWPTLTRAIHHSENSPWTTIIGDGTLRQQLQAQTTELGLAETLDLPGAMNHASAMKRIAEASLFVLPSLYEGFGMAAVEAMVLGVPVITSDFPASTEYIQEGVTGHRFPIGDHQRLADLIQWHINHPEESRQIGLNGQKFAREHYQPERIAKLHLDLYKRLLT